MSRSGYVALALVTALAAGCTSGTELAREAAPPTTGGSDLRGTWTGTWAGTPVTLVVTDQGSAGYSGIYAGPWLIFGSPRPGISAILTSMVRGAPVSSHAQGWVAQSGDATMLVVEAETAYGSQQLRLKSAGADVLSGSGVSSFGPKGEIILTRPPR